MRMKAAVTLLRWVRLFWRAYCMCACKVDLGWCGKLDSTTAVYAPSVMALPHHAASVA